jgi:hypothetical protein
MRCAREACAKWSPELPLFGRRRKGVWFDEAWYCGMRCVEAEARVRLEGAPEPTDPITRRPRVSRLGALLVHQRTVSREDLVRALEAQRESGLRLGAELRRMGVASPIEVLRALAAQSGVGYVATLDPAAVAHAPGGLSRDAVRALGVVPIDTDPDRRRLRVACAAPLPRLALAVLRELTGHAVEPLFVDDDLLAELVESYGQGAASRVRAVRAGSLGEATEHIARAIAEGRAQRIQPVRCDPWLWVRLEGEDVLEEIVLPTGAVGRKERSWQAEPMSH